MSDSSSQQTVHVKTLVNQTYLTARRTVSGRSNMLSAWSLMAKGEGLGNLVSEIFGLEKGIEI